ncbi:MAG: RIO1 family regulatory kinase/ATPase [Methanomassiliicoccales archaeon]|jgi:RIO kinase 1
MPNDPYLDASVAWRIKSGNIEFREADHRTTVASIISSGLATEIVCLISTGKEADVYLARYKGSPIAVKVYRLYRTSHKGGGPIKLDSAGWLAAHEYEMQHQAWKGGARVPTPARRFENMFSMRYLGDDSGHAPRLHDVRLDDPAAFMEKVVDGVKALAKAGVVHTDLSAFNVLVQGGEPWFIDFSEAVRVDRTGYSPWVRLTKAREALGSGLDAMSKYFSKYGLDMDVEGTADEIFGSLDRFGVMR